MRKIELNYMNISEVSQLPVDDAELLNIICDYQNYEVHIHLRLDSPGKKDINAQLSLFGVKLLNIPIDEPWGVGKYLNEVTGDAKEPRDENLLFNLKVLLNSGDEILVIAKGLLYKEE
jgi:hypothetical protein